MACFSPNKGILISGFERLNADEQAMKWNELMDLVRLRKGPLRVDRETSKDGKTTLVYLRERSLPEFFWEKIAMSSESLVERENDARAAIAHAFDPYINKSMLSLERSKGAAGYPGAHRDIDGHSFSRVENHNDEDPASQTETETETESESESASECSSFNAAGAAETMTPLTKVRIDRLNLQRLQAAVLERELALPPFRDADPAVDAHRFASNVELLPVNGLRKCPPGLSVVPFSPLSLICNCLFIDDKLSKTSVYNKGGMFERIKEAFEGALRRHESDFERTRAREKSNNAVYLTPMKGLRHVERVWRLPENLDANGDTPVKEWEGFYARLFNKAAINVPFGSIVLEPPPSYWEEDGNGQSKPIWTDSNIQGLVTAALRARDRGLKEGKPSQSITLAITNPELRRKVEDEFRQQENALFVRKRVAQSQTIMQKPLHDARYLVSGPEKPAALVDERTSREYPTSSASRSEDDVAERSEGSDQSEFSVSNSADVTESS